MQDLNNVLANKRKPDLNKAEVQRQIDDFVRAIAKRVYNEIK